MSDHRPRQHARRLQGVRRAGHRSPTRSTRRWPDVRVRPSCPWPVPRTVVVGHDMRPSSPGLAAAFAEGAADAGADVVDDRPGLDRPALLRLRSPRASRRDVHREPQPRAVQRDQAVPRGCRSRSVPTPGCTRSATPSRGPAPRRAVASRGTISAARRPRRLRRSPALARPGRPAAGSRSWSTPATAWPGLTAPVVFDRIGDDGRAGADVLRARRHLPAPRGQPDRAGEPRRPAGAGASRRAPTSAWPSTATPTAASSSTSAARPCRRRR